MMIAGCRTYGRYDATEKMLPEMRQSVKLFAGDLERARTNLTLLQQAASGDSALHVVVAEYAQAVARHEEILRENQQILNRYEDDLPTYRDMHRAFGAMLSEHQAARNRYRSLTRAVRYPTITRRMEPAEGPSDRVNTQRSLPDTLLRARDETFTEGRYYIAPIFYERLQSEVSDMTMRQALAERKQRLAQAGRLTPASGGGPLPATTRR